MLAVEVQQTYFAWHPHQVSFAGVYQLLRRTASAHKPWNKPRCGVVAKSAEESSVRRLDNAAAAFDQGLRDGKDADDLMQELVGVREEQYKDKVLRKLQERAEELRREREARAATFTLGKQAYARGQYPASSQLLEQALNEEGPFTPAWGGDPIVAGAGISNLRYIMEAPKLQLSPDERIQIPVLIDLDANRGGRSVAAIRPRGRQERKRPKSWDEEFWENYRPPTYLTNRYVWVASMLVAGALAWYSTVYKELHL